MKQNGSIALFQYWDRLRGARIAPKRTEIEPAEIKFLLADTFILELDARSQPIFRLAGTRICATFGKELKAFSFSSLWADRDRNIVTHVTDTVFNAQSAVIVTFTGTTKAGNSLSFELVMLPLDGEKENARALGAMTPEAKPFWLGVDPIIEARVDAMRIIDSETEKTMLRNLSATSVPSIVPDGSALTQRDVMPGQGRRFRHLVVFDGGRDN